jgi:hypothetical protein
MGLSLKPKSSRARKTVKSRSPAVQITEANFHAVVRSLKTTRAVADVLYRALRGQDLHTEEPTARVLCECIIDPIGSVLDTLHGLPGGES